MTRTRKTGRYFEKKIDRLIQANYPDITTEQLATATAPFLGTVTSVPAAWHKSVVEDLRYYTHANLYPNRETDYNRMRLGYCETHGLLHLYSRRKFVTTVEAARDAAIEQVQQLDPETPMSYELHDMLFNRFQGTMAFLLSKHEEQVGRARQAYTQQERVVLAEIYEELPLSTKIDFYMCGRKTPHNTPEEAVATRNTLPPEHPGLDTLVVYHCTWCDGYHLGHSDKRNDYTGADWCQVKVHADFTWYHSFRKAKLYVLRNGPAFDVKFTPDEVEPLIDPDRPKIFLGR